MATFARQTFSAGSYAAIRPTYPRVLFDAVYEYHARGRGGWGRALDLGCGTGQATAALAGFRDVVGVDPSAGMVATADELAGRASARVPRAAGTAHRYVQAAAEDLTKVVDNASVDLVIAAQAAHWFDYARVWPELARVLRRGGTVAFWGYSQFRLAGHPELTPLIHDYAQGADPAASLGPHWEQPGRRILDNHLLDLPHAPAAEFADHEHIFWTGAYYPSLPGARGTLLRKRVSWAGLQAYLRTFSSLHAFHEAHPEDAAQRTGLATRPAGGEGGDIVERFWWGLKETVGGDGVEIEWPMAMVLWRRR